MKGGPTMDNTVRIDVEGQVITLPLKYDPHARRWLESYCQ